MRSTTLTYITGWQVELGPEGAKDLHASRRPQLLRHLFDAIDHILSEAVFNRSRHHVIVELQDLFVQSGMGQDDR